MYIKNILHATGNDIDVYNMFKDITQTPNQYPPASTRGTIDFNKIIPEPYIDEDIANTDSNIKILLNAWKISNWGTLSSFHSEKYLGMSTEYSIAFGTCYSPAVPVIIKLSTMYPTIKFKYTWFVSELENSTIESIEVQNGIILSTSYRGKVINNIGYESYIPKLDDYIEVYDPFTGDYISKRYL